jgi:hypothetical protein
MRDLLPSLTPFERALARIDRPTARKLVVMSKWERGEISASEAERLIRELGLASA